MDPMDGVSVTDERVIPLPENGDNSAHVYTYEMQNLRVGYNYSVTVKVGILFLQLRNGT